MKRLQLLIKGRVQGVFFRDFVQKNSKGLTGWVKNTSEGVEVIAEGDEKDLKTLLENCRQGPEAARVDKIEENWSDATKEFDSFEIRY